jgi:TatD DNase family protein
MPPMALVDTHTHLDFPDFDIDRAQLLDQAQAVGVERMVVLAVQRDNWQRVWDGVKADARLSAALGLHPVFLEAHRPHHLIELRQWLDRLAGDPQLCAVGEFGLDYYLPELDRARQQVLFEAQLQIAADLHLPVLLHVRRSHAPVTAALKRFRLARGGVIHAFSGSHEEAREYLKLGFKLGLGGAATWPQALRLRKVIAQLPLDSVVLETDSPDMAPAMHPGLRNSPVHLPDICTALARIMGCSPEALAQASSANARQLFGWGPVDSVQQRP